MPSLPQLRQLLALVFCLALYGLPQASGADKSERVNFDTSDGVKIEGTYYASDKKQKAPCVILLHDFDSNGGSSRSEGFDSLATKLQEKGFAVLTFDFRGYGQSTSVSSEFWNNQKAKHNMGVQNFLRNSQLAAAGKAAKTISHKQFFANYYPNLVNDIAAAKTFLDNQNDGQDLNSRNVVVIGAGQGATLGLMWMDTEYKRHKGIVKENVIGPPVLLKLDDETGGNDLVAGIWLSISPTLGGTNMPVSKWLYHVGKTNKLPMALVYGKEEANADQRMMGYLKTIAPNFERGKGTKDKELEFTGEQAIAGTKLSGSKLLQSTLDTEDFIVNKYLAPLMEKHRFVQWKMRGNDDSYFYWKNTTGNPTLAKIKGDKVPNILPRTVAGY